MKRIKNKYYRKWVNAFPQLDLILKDEDKLILNEIDPVKYVSHNITNLSEVVEIINYHKPQAWKWIMRYPSLAELPAEDKVILDHMVPSDYIGDISEDDVRRIIKYRKEIERNNKETAEIAESRKYYEEHKDEIIEEENRRDRLTTRTKNFLLAGIVTASTGIAIKSVVCTTIGIASLPIAFLLGMRKLKKLNASTVIPKPRNLKIETTTLKDIITVVLFYIGFIGMGIILSTIPVWAIKNWDLANDVLLTGCIVTLASAILFVVTLIATSSDR